MVIWFVLRMRDTPTWNGSWSGAGRLYAKRVNVPKARAEELLKEGSFWWSWSDGWSCAVDVVKPHPAEARRMAKNTKGFCGYEWMINSIILYGRILDDAGVKKLEAEKAALMWRVLGVIEQMNEEHARNGGDMEMSLGGYFEPFPFERR